MPSKVDATGAPVVSKDADENWENDAIQFPRLIAEMEAAGYFGDERAERRLLEEAGMTANDMLDLVERANETWKDVKGRLGKR